MLDKILSLPSQWAVLIVAASPLIELRGAIPFGLLIGLPPIQVFVISVLGSILPVPILLSALGPVFNRFRNSKMGTAVVSFIKKRTHWKRGQIRRSGLVGLFILAAIPLPSTGAWTASIVSAMLGLQRLTSTAVIAAGIFVSGLIVLFLSMLGMLSLHQWFNY